MPFANGAGALKSSCCTPVQHLGSYKRCAMSSLALIVCGPICVFLILACVPGWGHVKVFVAMLTVMAAGAALYSGVQQACADSQSECLGATATAYGVGIIWLPFLILAFVTHRRGTSS
jgi:hypothetical protein